MSQLDLFGNAPDDDDLPPLARKLGPRLHALAEKGVYFGSSSWKYPGWLGSIYSPDRYTARGKFSEKKFESECLSEYALTFPAVGGDFSFYQFPSPPYWAKLFGETPDSLLFGLKVPENLTVVNWPRHARYGSRAGQANAEFLDPRVLRTLFLDRLERYRHRVGVLMFEFGTLSKSAIGTPAAFFERLGDFLGELPGGFRYAVEIRNPEFLGDAYFGTLAAHGVAHVFNAWTRMPELGDQIALPGAFTADFSVVRALLPRGRSYEQAVAALEPYELIREPDEPARAAMREVAKQAIARRKPAFLFVNNRLEGHSPGTIDAVTEGLDEPG